MRRVGLALLAAALIGSTGGAAAQFIPTYQAFFTDGSERLGFYVIEAGNAADGEAAYSVLVRTIETDFAVDGVTLERIDLSQRFGDAARAYALTSTLPARTADDGIALAVLDGTRAYLWVWVGDNPDRQGDFLALAADYLPVAERELAAGIDSIPDADGIAHRFGGDWHESDTFDT